MSERRTDSNAALTNAMSTSSARTENMSKPGINRLVDETATSRTLSSSGKDTDGVCMHDLQKSPVPAGLRDAERQGSEVGLALPQDAPMVTSADFSVSDDAYGKVIRNDYQQEEHDYRIDDNQTQEDCHHHGTLRESTRAGEENMIVKPKDRTGIVQEMDKKKLPQIDIESEKRKVINWLLQGSMSGQDTGRYDPFTRFLRQIIKAPATVMLLLDKGIYHLNSNAGDFVCSAEVQSSMSRWLLDPENESILVVEDTLTDDRFFDNPFVKESPFIRFFAGCRLEGKDGHIYGTLFLIDYKPRNLSNEECQLLSKFAELATRDLEHEFARKMNVKQLHEKLSESETSLKYLLYGLDILEGPLSIVNVAPIEWPMIYANPAWMDLIDMDDGTRDMCRSKHGLHPSGWVPFWHNFINYTISPSEAVTAYHAVQHKRPFRLTLNDGDASDTIRLLFRPITDNSQGLHSSKISNMDGAQDLENYESSSIHIKRNQDHLLELQSAEYLHTGADHVSGVQSQLTHLEHISSLPAPLYYIGTQCIK